jgi:hypothetical protein
MGINKAANEASESIHKGKIGLKFGQLESGDIIWFGLSGVIALLIFSNFQHEVNLTGNILANISLAFAIGFGVDKSLEAINKFRSSQ